MNYRHAFHAGNFADVLKHATLALAIEHLKRKDKAFVVIDTHAGTGSYDLQAEEAARTREAAGGIDRLLARRDPHPLLAPYLTAVRNLNRTHAGDCRWYPGSPRLAYDLLRPADRLVAVELHPRDLQALAAEFGADRRVDVHGLDGWLALKSFLPPRERRGLVLVDPPFERPGEYGRLVDGLRLAHRRWATGVYILWYAIKDEAEAAAFVRDVAALALPRTLLVELRIGSLPGDARMSGCGLVLVNPPWRLDEELRALLPWLQSTLARGPGAGHRVEWLVGERPSGQTAAKSDTAFGEE